MRPWGLSPLPVWPLPPWYLRHTAGGRPSVTPGTGRIQVAAVTPAGAGRARTAQYSRRSGVKPREFTVHQGPNVPFVSS
jgi:hypothetical protein